MAAEAAGEPFRRCDTVEFDIGVEGAAAATAIHTKFTGAPAGMKAECLNLSMYGTARAMAKLLAFMANKGTLKGQQFISEDTWNDLMSNPKCKKMLTFLPMTMNKGGLGVMGLENTKQ